MNPIQELIVGFQELVAQMPTILQPLIVMLAGAIPFIEGEVAAMIGIVGGVNPLVAAVAGAVGNFLCVLAVVMITSRARSAVVNRKRVPVGVTVGGSDQVPTAVEAAEALPETPSTAPESKGRQRFKKWLVRFGVPGASILGPLAIPTQFTAAILAAGGTPKGWVLLWQAVAIVIWTTVATVSIWAALTFVIGV